MSVLSLAKPGPPPLPRAVKEARGTLERSRENPAEPDLDAIALPAPPADLTKRERETWLELAAAVDPMRVTTAADLVAFRLMVEAVARAHELARARNVYAFVATQKLALTHLAQWGLTPAMRRRVSSIGEAPSDEGDPLAEFASPGKPGGRKGGGA